MNFQEEWSNVRLAETYWLWFFLLIPLLYYLSTRMRGQNASLRFSSLTNVKVAKPINPWAVRWILPALRLLTFACLVFALARPQRQVEENTPLEASGVDIVIAVDLSASMLALDMGESSGDLVTRLDVVKRVIEDFVSKRKSDRIGLVGFASNPYLISPLTLDKEHLKKSLKRLSVGLTEQAGTNIGGALAESINRVRTLSPVTFEITVKTSNGNNSQTNGAIAISFLVNGSWTQEETFFTGAKVGEKKIRFFETTSRPTKMRLSAKSNDDWGYQKITADGEIIFEDSSGRMLDSKNPLGYEHNFQWETDSRIVILLTDGKDEPPPRHSPMIFAKGAQAEGIKVYTIAVGQKTETPSYILHPKTRQLQRYPDGSLVVKRAVFPVDKEILRKISETTGAKFYEAGNEATLRQIYDEIDKLEKRDLKRDADALFEELFHWPMAAGLILLLIEIALSRTLLLRIP